MTIQIAMRGNQGGGGDPPQEGQSPSTPVKPSGSAVISNEEPNPADTNGSEVLLDENGEPFFPHAELAKLDDMISRPRWIVPVLPGSELEVLLIASINLCKKGLDTRSEACQRFFQEGLTKSFTKILTDEAVSTWKFDIHRYIFRNCERLVELCVVKLNQDWFPLLDLLAMVFNPHCKFHTYNVARNSETVPVGAQVSDEEIFARPLDGRALRGWLVDLINKFGRLGGFQILLERFQSGQNLTLSVMYALIRPFGLCYELLTVPTIVKYLMPIVEVVPVFLDQLTDEELKKEAKHESKNDVISALVKALKCIASRVPRHDDSVLQRLEMFRLSMILRLLRISSFNGKMHALNEINKVIGCVASGYPTHRGGSGGSGGGVTTSVSTTAMSGSLTGSLQHEEEEWLTAEKMAAWLRENKVLQIVLSDSLHQPQYVEKLEKILRFVIKEKALTLEDLDNIWASQAGKHEAIVKNVHDLLAKLAWDFSPEQLDHLFECFQASWTTAGKKQREKLLELIRRLAEDDKDGVMANKVLTLFWNLAHSSDVATEIMDQALSAHVKILDYSCCQDRDAQKTLWLDRCVKEISNPEQNWVLQALRQIRDICCLYAETPANFNHTQRTPHMLYRQEVVNRLQQQHSLVILLADNLTKYMERVRQQVRENPSLDPNTFLSDGRYPHLTHVQERLNFLRFLLKDGQLWLCAPQAKQIWQTLVERAVFPADREACFRWFSKLMSEEPDLDPEINKDFFENNILQLDPVLLTESGMKCFDRFFKAVNAKEGKLVGRRKMDDVELIGMDYLWKVILNGGEEIAQRAIELLKDTYTNLGPRLITNQIGIHEEFVGVCMDRLKTFYDTVSVLDSDKDSLNRVRQETTRLCRVLRLLHLYVTECDAAFREERQLLPLGRAYRGKHLTLTIRFPSQNRQLEDIEVWTHSRDTVASLRRQILHRLKGAPITTAQGTATTVGQVTGALPAGPGGVVNASVPGIKLDLFLNSELLDPAEDQRLIGDIPIRDKTLLSAKLSQMGSAVPGSPDSSSDSSVGSPQHVTYGGTHCVSEVGLPAVIMSRKAKNAQFLCQVVDLGCNLGNAVLRDSARALLLAIPADVQTAERVRGLCVEQCRHNEVMGINNTHPSLEALFFTQSPAFVLYHLEVLYSLLMPANGPTSDKAFELQYNFVRSGGISLVLSMCVRNNFMPSADPVLKRAAFLAVLRLSKFVLTVCANATLQVLVEAYQNGGGVGDGSGPGTRHHRALILQQALQHIPSPVSDLMLRNVAVQLSQNLGDKAVQPVPDLGLIQALLRLAWAASAGCLQQWNTSWEELHRRHESNAPQQTDNEDLLVCREALENMVVALTLCPYALDTLKKDEAFSNFIIDILVLSPQRSIRILAAEQLYLMATRCSGDPGILQFFINLLFSVLPGIQRDHALQSHEYFSLLTRLINYAAVANCALPGSESLLNTEVMWLKKVRETFLASGSPGVEDAVLEGRLGLIRELVTLLGPEKKCQVGSDNSTGMNLMKELLDDFLFTASRWLCAVSKGEELPPDPVSHICSSSTTTVAAMDLLVALATGTVANMRYLVRQLVELFYSESTSTPLSDWEYFPPIGPRQAGGFVGLKNAGATCYMNSVLQQLSMIERIRTGVLKAHEATMDPDEDFSGEDRPAESDSGHVDGSALEMFGDERKEDSSKEYNVIILKHVQAIFGYLSQSKLQYYIPRGLWKHFKLQGEPVNLREQQDAVEFYMSLVDSVDEALKSLGHAQVMSQTLVGLYSDQKICKGCPHRYCKEQPFNVISIDIRNQSNLLESLEQYVKGELLEGGDAYHCEKCNKKVVTVKRLCVKKLPPVLTIQLKRFEYDYERVCPIKFNDYFEFPRELDMYPYTVWGLGQAEGEVIDDEDDPTQRPKCTRYQLTGIVVHSGQASGGHYYSYILHRNGPDQSKWYKFDDGEVTECKMDDDEEMKNQCFGGEYMGEVFDHVVKRMSYRRQKRWWNAYILFYTRVDVVAEEEEARLVQKTEQMTLENSQSNSLGQHKAVTLPLPIARSIRRQNMHFVHTYQQFSPEFFHFMRRLLTCNVPYLTTNAETGTLSPEAEELAVLSVELGAKFLFNSCFHSKKTLRGSAHDWYEALSQHMRTSAVARQWFAQDALFQHTHRFAEYLLQCPTGEVRSAFVKILVSLAHYSLPDGPFPAPLPLPQGIAWEVGLSLSDALLLWVLSLLNREVSEYGRHLSQYFSLFFMYGSLGLAEKAQLLRLDVLATLMLVALDEGPGPPIKYQYAELGKLYQVVSLLIRCCDVSSKTQSSIQGNAPLANPWGEPSCPTPIMPIQPQVGELLYGKSTFVKKLIEDANGLEDTVKLLRFLCWENVFMSSVVLAELLSQIGYAYTYELRPHLDLLLHILLLEDSWQKHRISSALRGIPDDRDGLFDIIQRSKNHYQKRAYQAIKCLVNLFSTCPAALAMLQVNVELKRKWAGSVEWLHEELDRRPYAAGNNQYGGYNQWSPPAQSNETSNGYFLERSHSARLTLEKAIELCPEEEPEEDVAEDAEVVTEENVPKHYATLPPLQTAPPSMATPSLTLPRPPGNLSGRPSPGTVSYSSVTNPSMGARLATTPTQPQRPSPSQLHGPLGSKQPSTSGKEDVDNQS